MSSRRVGLFGGTFDPVHNAHVALAHDALAALSLDHVRWIPTGEPWQKEGHALTPALHREAMVRLATAGENRFQVDRIEIERPGPSYTLDTVRALHAAEPGVEWVLILGQDQYAGLHTWHDWRELLALVTVAVANRPGPVEAPDAAVQAAAGRVLGLPLPLLDISSTDIRRRVETGADISQLVPPQVARYIETHRFYTAQGRSERA